MIKRLLSLLRPWSVIAILLVTAAGASLLIGRPAAPEAWIAVRPSIVGNLAALGFLLLVVLLALHPRRLGRALPLAALAAGVLLLVGGPFLAAGLARLGIAPREATLDLRAGAAPSVLAFTVAGLAAVLLPSGTGHLRRGLCIGLGILAVLIGAWITIEPGPGPLGVVLKEGALRGLVLIAAGFALLAAGIERPATPPVGAGRGLVDRAYAFYLVRLWLVPLAAGAAALPLVAAPLLAPWPLVGAIAIGAAWASGVAFIALAVDKRSSEKGLWRVPERTLHVIEAVGGWPGSLVGQQVLKHKRRKAGYRRVCFGMIVLHVLWTGGLVAARILLERG